MQKIVGGQSALIWAWLAFQEGVQKCGILLSGKKGEAAKYGAYKGIYAGDSLPGRRQVY